MNRKYILPGLILLISILILSSCSQEPPRPEGASTSAELLAEPVYNIPIKVYGQVSGLGEFECPCFALKSGDAQIYVWYDMIAEEDGSLKPETRPPVDIKGIENGDWIVVSGELKFFDNRRILKDFWLEAFEVIQ